MRSKVDEGRVLDMYERGMSLRQIGAEFGVCHHTIASVMDRLGVDRRGRGRKEQWGNAVQPQLAPELSERILQMYGQGLSVVKVSRELKLSESTVRRTLCAAGVKPRGWCRKPVDLDKVKALYERGLSTREVAAELGVPPSRVYRNLAEAGMPLRERQFSVRLRKARELATAYDQTLQAAE